MSEIAIEAKGLTRYFGTKPVVRQVDFQVEVGSVVGLLGLNGAGKTTTIKMLMGLLEPTRGQCSVLGVESMKLTAADRVRIGYTIEGHFLYSRLTVREAEQLQSDCFPNWDSLIFQSTLQRFGIDPKERIRNLSRGQRAGISIALTLSSQPELLILDDPSLGLDPVSRRALNETILEFMESGNRTVLLSSHMLDDIERVTDRVLIMLDGRIVVDSELPSFVARLSTWQCERTDNDGSVSIPRLILHRHVGSQSVFVVLDADEKTESAIRRIGGESVRRTDTTFDEGVIAYMSRQRSSASWLSSSAQAY
jgi:ABC-2 type transport system ATP-binding protein